MVLFTAWHLGPRLHGGPGDPKGRPRHRRHTSEGRARAPLFRRLLGYPQPNSHSHSVLLRGKIYFEKQVTGGTSHLALQLTSGVGFSFPVALAVGLEAVFALVPMSVLLVPFYFIKVGPKFGANERGVLEGSNTLHSWLHSSWCSRPSASTTWLASSSRRFFDLRILPRILSHAVPLLASPTSPPPPCGLSPTRCAPSSEL